MSWAVIEILLRLVTPMVCKLSNPATEAMYTLMNPARSFLMDSTVGILHTALVLWILTTWLWPQNNPCCPAQETAPMGETEGSNILVLRMLPFVLLLGE